MKHLTFATVFLVILPIMLFVILENILYRSTFAYQNQSDNSYPHYETYTYTVDGREVDVVYRDRGDRDVFVYFHGNVGRLNYILDYLNQNVSFIALAYPGYHRSEGRPDVTDTLQTIDEFLPHILNLFGEEIRLHVIGHSLGSQTAAYFTHLLISEGDDRLKTLSLVAGFPSIRNQCNNVLGAFSFLCFPANDSFNANAYLKVFKNDPAIDEPLPQVQIRVYHLPDDHRIPYQDGRKFYNSIALPENPNLDEEGIGKQFIDFTSGNHGNFDIAQVVTDSLGF